MAGPRMAGPLLFLTAVFAGLSGFGWLSHARLTRLAHSLECLTHGLDSLLLALQDVGLFGRVKIDHLTISNRRARSLSCLLINHAEHLLSILYNP